MFPTTAESFEYEDAGTLSAEEILEDPTWSLCCFDFESNKALFAQTPEEVDLAAAPFHYIAQYDNATALASMPLNEFEKTAEDLAWPEHVLYVPNTGRCGSTLLSKAFGAVPGVLSISESDDLSQISFDMFDGKLQEDAAILYARAAMKWRGAQPYRGQTVNCLVNKPRAEGTGLTKVLQQAVPNLKILFMYRAADAWLRSAYTMYRAAVDMDDPEMVETVRAYWSSFDPLIEEYIRDHGPADPLALLILNWCHQMETYLSLYKSSPSCSALRYEDLVRNPREVLGHVFDFAGVQVFDWAPVLATFEEDAQEGSPLSREQLRVVGKAMPEGAMAAAMNIVRSRSKLGSPDVILPGSL